MLKRYAFLVGSTQGTPPLLGAREDLLCMGNYLMSSTGGAWRKNELRIFLNRSAPDILDEVDRIRRCQPDYFMFYWSGHGYIEDAGQVIAPTPEEVITLKCFFGVADRQMMILDTCREFEPASNVSMDYSNWLTSASTESVRSRYRQVYDHYIAKCHPGLQIAYSTQPGETSVAHQYGSVYTTLLVDRASRWNYPSRRKHGVVSIRSLMRRPYFDGRLPGYFNSARKSNPRCFPFAVKLHCR